MTLSRRERLELGKRRVISILTTYKIALARTLEQKISDAGPVDQRIDPHVLTNARKELEETEQVRIYRGYQGVPWYHLSETPKRVWKGRLAELEPIHRQILAQDFGMRVGQALEIAVFRALCDQDQLQFLGNFEDLDQHGDELLYKKEEPPSAISGHTIPDDSKLDFVIVHPSTPVGIEVKNVREWLYPDRDELKDVLWKCCHLDAVPVLIARRIPYVTFNLLSRCGVILHQAYNQRYPLADRELAEKAKHKNLLGYHDIRLGNKPDKRLLHFIHNNLPKLIPEARESFEGFKDLLCDYANDEISYKSFAARVRRRYEGQPEDFDIRENY